jgi:hypothetical protein
MKASVSGCEVCGLTYCGDSPEDRRAVARDTGRVVPMGSRSPRCAWCTVPCACINQICSLERSLASLSLARCRFQVRILADETKQPQPTKCSAICSLPAPCSNVVRYLPSAEKSTLLSRRAEFVHGVNRRLGHKPSNAEQVAMSAELALNRLSAFMCSFITEQGQ